MNTYLSQNWIEIVGATLGLIYLYYEYRASSRMWPLGIAMSLFYTYVYIDAKFYSFAIINIYFIVLGVYGWIKWLQNKNNKKGNILLRHCPIKLFMPILISIVLIFSLLVFILTYLTDSPVTYGDSFITTFSIVAMWMLTQRYVEQWILLTILNVVSVFIYMQQQLYATTILYTIYSIASYFGYLRWKNSVIKENEDI